MRFFFKRIFTLIITLWLVSILTFGAFNIVPGDPAALILGTEATPARLAQLRNVLGLDKPLPTRYVEWLVNFLGGDFGNSIKYSLPVKDLIGGRIPVTAWLAVLAITLIIIISIPLGVYSAKKRNTVLDKFLSGFTMINLSIPGFFLGVIFIWLFGLQLKFFTPGKYVDYNTDFGGFIGYLLFPALAIALPNIAIVVKFLKNSVVGQLSADYVRTAYSKGNTDNAVLYRHVLRNALVPVITLLGMIIAEIFSGSIIMEQVFGIPGIGRLLITSISFRDFPMIETLVVYIAFIVIFVNFLVDVIFQLIDPRIRVN